MKYVIYVRVSTDDQKVGRDAQIKMCRDYCSKLNPPIEISEDHIYIDEGLSGSLPFDKRVGIFSAIGSLKKDDILLVAKRDRLSRGDAMSMAMIESAVLRKHARIISVSGEGTENDDPSSVLMRRMVDAFGEYERLIIKSRTKSALQLKKSRNECVGHIPFGQKRSDDNIHLEPCEEEVETIKMILKLREDKMTYNEIVNHMNNNNILNRGRYWTYDSIFHLIKRNY